MEQLRQADIIRAYRRLGSMTQAVQAAGYPSIAHVPDMARIWALVQEEE